MMMSTFTPSKSCEQAQSTSSSKCPVFPSSVMFFKLFMWSKVLILIEEMKMSISDMTNSTGPEQQACQTCPKTALAELKL